MKILTNLDLVKNQLLNSKFHILASDPGTPEEGQFWYNSTTHSFRYFDGTDIQEITAGALSGLLDSDPIVVTDNGNGTFTISISAASGSAAGSMSAEHWTKLEGIAAGANAYSHPNHTGDVTSVGDGATTIAANVVSNTKLRDSAALSVIGRSANSSGDPGDIEAAADGDVLRRSGTALGFGKLVDANIDAAAGIAQSKISGLSTTLGALVPTTRTISTTAPLSGGGALSSDLTLSIAAATTGAAGSMSASDKTKLDNATNANTASTLVLRDASGNFNANIITASLSGTASNASQLNSQNPAHYLDRTNHTGTQTASTISNFDTAVRANRLDQMAAPTAAVSMNNQRITNVLTPSGDNDAANKAYVDAARTGLDAKESVRAATTGTITLSGTQTIDGVSVVAGNRVLVKNQSTGNQNGIYVVAAGAWSRAADADASDEVTPGMFVFVEEGATNAASGWVLSTSGTIVLGTTALDFVQFSGAGQILAGNGIDKTGNTLSVVGTSDRISVSGAGVDIASTYVGQASIVTLGSITTGTWNADTIAVGKGGTGVTTITGLVSGNGTNAFVGRTITGTTDRVTVTNGSGATANPTIDIASTYVGQSSITTVGTITSGTWGATDVAVEHGGTGASDAAGARANLGAVGKYAVNIGNGVLTQFTVNHALNTRDVQVSIYLNSGTYEQVVMDVEHTDANNVTVRCAVAPSSNQYRVVVIG